MTFIVSLGNHENIIQLSDRRLSFNGIIGDYESNKIGIFVCKNARFAVGFTGLAKCDKFETQSWIAKLLCDSGPPDFDAKSILDRFTERATYVFKNNPLFKKITNTHKRLSVMFTGYLYQHSPPLVALALVSNFENLDDGSMNKNAQNKFSVFYHTEPRPNPPRMKLFNTIGFSPGNIYSEDFNEAIDMMVDKLPIKNIEWKLVKYIRKISNHPNSQNTIGEQISSVIVPSDRQKDFICSYYPTSKRVETYMPNFICAIDNDKLFATKNIKISYSGNQNDLPIVGPKLHPNQKCWCDSGLRYKHCHGSKNRIIQGPSIDFNKFINEIKKGKRNTNNK